MTILQRLLAVSLLCTLLLPLTQLTFAQSTNNQGTEPNIIVTRPTANALVGNPIIIQGEARVFENNLNYRLLDAQGHILTQGFTTADAPDIGEFGDFSITASYTPTQASTGTLEIFSLSPMDGSVINLVTAPVRFPSTANVQTQVPLYRLYNSQIHRHFYTTSAAERDAAVRRYGFVFEGTVGFVYRQAGANLMPLYRTYNPSTRDHFYTANLTERNAAINKFGYVAEGITGYLNASKLPNNTNLYRLYHARLREHFYTASPTERTRADNVLGYNDEGTAGYVVPVEQQSLVKVFFGNSFLNPNIADCSAVFPVVREVPHTVAVGTAATNALIGGPSSTESSEGYISSLPQGVILNSLRIENGTAFADFNSALEESVGGSCRVIAIRSQIEQTLKQFPTVQRVVISINGRTEDILQP